METPIAFKDERWIEVRVIVPPEAVEAVSAFCFDRGSTGITEETEVQGDPRERARPGRTDPSGEPRILLRIYFAEATYRADTALEADLRRALREAGAGSPRVWVDEVAYGNWAEGWKAHFKPRSIGRRLVVAPSWERVEPQEGRVVVRVDPGMAFGTGQHETTSLCLVALEDAIGRADPADGLSVLDVGTGSGILAIAAVRLGASRAVGIDNDPEAVAAARENVAENGLEGTVAIDGRPLEAVDGRFPIVVANILAEALIAMAPSLAAKVEPGGALILSGILSHLAGSVADAYRARGFSNPEVRREGEWVCLVTHAPS